MGHRPGFTVTKLVPCDGGESPNAYVARVTVEIRVRYPAKQTALAAEVLEDAIEEARARMTGEQP